MFSFGFFLGIDGWIEDHHDFSYIVLILVRDLEFSVNIFGLFVVGSFCLI